MYYVDRLQSPSAGSIFAPIAAPAASAHTVSATAHSTVWISAAAGAGGRPALLQRAAAGPGVGWAGRAADGGSAGGGQWVGVKRRSWPPSAHQPPFPPPLGRYTAAPRCSARAGAEGCAAAALPPARASAPPPPRSRGPSRRQGRAASPGEPPRPAAPLRSSAAFRGASGATTARNVRAAACACSSTLHHLLLRHGTVPFPAAPPALSPTPRAPPPLPPPTPTLTRSPAGAVMKWGHKMTTHPCLHHENRVHHHPLLRADLRRLRSSLRTPSANGHLWGYLQNLRPATGPWLNTTERSWFKSSDCERGTPQVRVDAIHRDDATWCCAFCSDDLHAMAGSSSPNLEIILTSSCWFQMQMMTEQEIRDQCGPVVQITIKVIQKQGEYKRIL